MMWALEPETEEEEVVVVVTLVPSWEAIKK
jgi:hypothetical protein